MKVFIKKISALVVISAIASFYSGCNRSHLDLLPHGPTEESYFTEENDFAKGVLGVYAKINDVYWYRGNPYMCTMPMYLLPGDDITTNEANEEFEIFGSLQPSTERVTYFYTVWYQLIARANTLLEKIEGENGVYQTPNLKNYNKGEALFLRGYAFYNLWNYFGTAPLTIERVKTSEQFTPPGTTGTQLLDQAILDFTEAASLLPPSWDAANRGRVTKNSAFGMMGKSLVFRASATNNTSDYTAAISALNSISGAGLTADFTDNFAWDTENNGESLFEYQATQAFALDNVWLENDFDNAVGNLSVFYSFYSVGNGNIWDKSPFYATTKLVNAFEPDDPRRDLTLNAATHEVKKYVTRDKLNQVSVGSVNNPRILRYADVLLLKAEATLQSGGSAAEAIGYINEVRTRARSMVAGGTIPANYATAETDKTKIMNWIMNERLIELAGEGQRWFDIRRWQMQGIITLDNAFFSSNTSTMSFQLPKHLLFPIPSSEIDVNPNVPQNAGY
ncbi:RagB/SusD family nutrient uptake outer membrane protein [Agriterribacter sp.]|uniref:RagB/SusD family nutrient uptake outer membrane protein n=1 Tax=Agriterribacter sp. TaxID=2821509 RepID=UPI002B7A61A8|nr:RagB/SusD family nutrient uptake outer membrane protein [Agriterribacter sp.]HRO45771.1 RagB/SusD family nutrient uptake outer membrane protein [Agriterribacter sp.]HRQ16774.1 RagB/SusD family nutrient uptake outer membrane protein [Agriterribacter sp.]